MEMSRVPYASAVGSFVYVMICTRPYIAQEVGVISVRIRGLKQEGGELF